MKNLSTLLIVFVLLVACNAKKVDVSQTEPQTESKTEVLASKTDCVVGEWYLNEGSFKKTFTFNTDKTGVEVQAADDIRNFTWVIKNDQPVIVYNGDTTEWAFSLDCEKVELVIFMAVYKKE